MAAFSNAKLAGLLREVAAAYTIKKQPIFKIRAYENAADYVEHATSEVKDLWEEGKLDQVPGLGESLQAHLDELFKTGQVKHWNEVKSGIKPQVFQFLQIPGVGSKTALELAELGVRDLADLKEQIDTGVLAKKGFSTKLAEKLRASLNQLESTKTGRMLLPYAFAQAEKIIGYLKQSKDILKVDSLGSLRRMVATIGDLDFSVSSNNPEKAVEYITKLPGSRVIDQGEYKVTLVLSSGLHLDFLVSKPDSYGALLQHFTGSKQHNIHLRTLAEKKGYSLSEYGVRRGSRVEGVGGRLIKTRTEEEFYKLLGMQTPPPEIREDGGEIEAALAHKLPHLVELNDIVSDLHLHSNFPLEPSHGPGAHTIEQIAEKGKELGYKFLGISDHPPSVSGHSSDQMIELIQIRSKHIEQLNSSGKYIRVLNLLEVDIQPDGTLSVPEAGLKQLDFAIAGVHTAHRQTKQEMTKRLIRALENPHVKVLVHPTGRLLNERESCEADWEAVFKPAAKLNKALEINAYPNRLDMSDTMARQAAELGVKVAINTDSHDIEQMSNMRFGVAMARRGWIKPDQVINTWDLPKLLAWSKI